MIIALLTPLLLATAPVRIDLPEGVYNHTTQVSEYKDGTSTHALSDGRTANGTRTFDFQGRPYDNDND